MYIVLRARGMQVSCCASVTMNLKFSFVKLKKLEYFMEVKSCEFYHVEVYWQDLSLTALDMFFWFSIGNQIFTQDMEPWNDFDKKE